MKCFLYCSWVVFPGMFCFCSLSFCWCFVVYFLFAFCVPIFDFLVAFLSSLVAYVRFVLGALRGPPGVSISRFGFALLPAICTFVGVVVCAVSLFLVPFWNVCVGKLYSCIDRHFVVEGFGRPGHVCLCHLQV